MKIKEWLEWEDKFTARYGWKKGINEMVETERIVNKKLGVRNYKCRDGARIPVNNFLYFSERFDSELRHNFQVGIERD